MFRKKLRKFANQEYVRMAYKSVMGREPDAKGLKYFTELFNKHNDLTKIIDLISNSDEGRNYLNSSQMISNRAHTLEYLEETHLWKNNQSVEAISTANFQPKYILIIKLDHIGDFVLSLDAILLIKKNFSDAKICILCASWNAPLAKATGLFDQIYVCDILNSRADKGDFIISETTIKNLPKQEFDIAIDLRVQSDTRLVLKYIVAKYKCGYEASQKHIVNITLPQPKYKGKDDYEYSSKNHMFALAAKVVHIFGISPVVKEYIQKFSNIESIEAVPSTHSNLKIVIQPFSGASIKNWPIDRYIELVRKFILKFDAKIDILGSDLDVNEEILIKLSKIHQNVKVRIGNTSIYESISLIQSCDLYIGNDTGLTHISAALNKPTIVIFSGTEIITLFAPSNKSSHVLKASMQCSPCYLSRIEDCINDHKCMTVITTDQIYGLAESILNSLTGDVNRKHEFITEKKEHIVYKPINIIKPKKTITICAVDCLYPELAARAISKSMQKFHVEDAILFTDAQVDTSVGIVKINKITSIEEYNKYILHGINQYIHTDYVLIVQWDGYVTDPLSWSDEFLNYDYIGAVWPQYQGHNSVGNGGFSLRSKRLLEAIQHRKFYRDEKESEDNAICRTNRRLLEDSFGISFAPESVANLFSYEQVVPNNPTFGFHGIWNIWRHENDEVVLDILDKIPDSYYTNYMMMKMLMQYFYIKNRPVFMLLYKKSFDLLGRDRLKKTLIMALKYDEKDVERMFKYAFYNKWANKFRIY